MLESLCWKRELFALENFSDVQVEEVTIQDGLHNTGNDGDQIKETFKVVSPDPVDQVEGTVAAEGEQVMSRDRFRFTRLTDHEQLRQDGDRFQVDTEGPEDFKWGKVVVDEEGEATDWHDEELGAERVVVSVVRCLEFHVDEVDGGVGA